MKFFGHMPISIVRRLKKYCVCKILAGRRAGKILHIQHNYIKDAPG